MSAYTGTRTSFGSCSLFDTVGARIYSRGALHQSHEFLSQQAWYVYNLCCVFFCSF
jgi:hypothetical protein